MLKIENVFMKYEGSNQGVLKNINLTLPDKGLVFIIGASGSGKSTLLNLIAGFMKPESGSIYFNGKDITKFNTKEINNYIGNDVAVIHQNYNLIKYLNVDDNIKLKNKNYDRKILTRLGISHLKNKKINKLSGGEAQRVAIARGLSNSTSIILADEPTGALDSKNSLSIIKLLKKISKNILIIVVTHDNELIKYGDRIITIKDGEIKRDVQKSKVINNEKRDKKTNKSKKDILSLVIKNLFYKSKRNLLTTLAFSIGLITLLLVLSISNGFNIALDESEKTTLATYPITINENSYDIDNALSDIFVNTNNDTNKINVIEGNHKNIIDEKFISYVKSLEEFSNHIEYSYYVDNVLINTISDIVSFYKDINILSGSKIDKELELILLVDNNNNISSDIAMMLNLDDNSYDYNELIGTKINIENDIYTIKAIAKGDEESFYTDSSGLYSIHEFRDIPLSVNIIPKDYESKLKIISRLKDYGDIEFSDYASSIKSISSNIIDAVTTVLIIFSSISLIITSFMIGIITYISVLERVKDIGVLKAIGFSNRDIKKVFYLENIIIALVSSILSILFILLITIPLNNFLFNLLGLENIILLDVTNIINIIFLSIVISLIGSLIPINKIKRLDILKALNYE